MIPPVPLLIRFPIGLALMSIAVVIGSAADWLVPEMKEGRL